LKTTSTSKLVLGALLAVAAAGATAGATTTPPVATTVRAPMVCSRGPGGKQFSVALTLPRTAEQSSTYTVRIDGVPSGEISAFGLNHIRDMATDYTIPPGATYVPGSARVIPGTGTPNVATGARVWYEPGLIKMALPGRVESGSSYTPPAIEFQLAASAPAGASLPLDFFEYRVTANAIIVGDVLTVCKPTPKPYPLGATLVTPKAPPPPP
jgi:hypothetical protein